MIQINLIKDLVSAPKKRSFQFTTRTRIIIAASLFSIFAASTVVVVLRTTGKKVEQVEVAKSSGFDPSTFKSRNKVEDIVEDIHEKGDALNRSGVLKLPYENLSFEEKVNFEALFAKKAIEVFARGFPDWLGTRSISIDNFKTFQVTGISEAKEDFNAILERLMNEDVKLLRPPQTLASRVAAGGYSFIVTCEAAWGLDHSDPFVDPALAALPMRDALDIHVDRFSNLARESGLRMTQEPNLLRAKKENEFKRFAYRFSAQSSAEEFFNFIRALYERRMQVAFERCKIQAIAHSRVEVDAIVVFTTKY